MYFSYFLSASLHLLLSWLLRSGSAGLVLVALLVLVFVLVLISSCFGEGLLQDLENLLVFDLLVSFEFAEIGLRRRRKTNKAVLGNSYIAGRGGSVLELTEKLSWQEDNEGGKRHTNGSQ